MTTADAETLKLGDVLLGKHGEYAVVAGFPMFGGVNRPLYGAPHRRIFLRCASGTHLLRRFDDMADFEIKGEL